MSFYLFNKDHPRGRLFTVGSEVELVASGDWFDHPDKVTGDNGANQQTLTARAGDGPEPTQAPGDPRYTLAEILAPNTSFFTLPQLAEEASKHGMVLAYALSDGSFKLAPIQPEVTKAPATPPAKPKEIAYDNEAVAAMVLRGNTEPLKHEHLVSLAKLLGVKSHKVKQPDLIATLKATLQAGTPPETKPGEDGDDAQHEDDDEVVLGTDGKPVAPLKPKTD